MFVSFSSVLSQQYGHLLGKALRSSLKGSILSPRKPSVRKIVKDAAARRSVYMYINCCSVCGSIVNSFMRLILKITV